MHGPTVCIVIPTTYSDDRWLRLALESVCDQRGPILVRIVGRGSKGLLAVVGDYGAEFIPELGHSLSEALNQGFSQLPPTVKYIGWLGDDDLLAPKSLALTQRALDLNPAAPFAFGRVRYINADGTSKWLIRPGAWSVMYGRWGHNFIAQQGGLIRRSSFEAVGGVDNSLKNSMDQDLFLKLASAGRPAYLGRELGAWRIHAASISSQKGMRDESKDVMRRYRPKLPVAVDTAMTMLVKFTDRILLSTHCRIPGPPPPMIEGVPYTMRAPSKPSSDTKVG